MNNHIIKKQLGPWIHYANIKGNLDYNKCGKWMYHFNNLSFAAKISEKAVSEGIVVESKHSIAEEGMCCFYLNNDDTIGHKRCIQFFLDNNLIPKTKTGKLYNISFKLNEQTRKGEYGNKYHSDLKLENFLDLETGRWK